MKRFKVILTYKGKDKVMASDLSQSVANEVAGRLRNSNKGKIIKVVKQ